MKGFTINIEKKTLENEHFREVLYTAKNCQLVVMSLSPKEEIGEEVHTLDQFFRVEKGSGLAILGGVKHKIEDGSTVIVPAGLLHNIVNTGAEPLKLYTLYMPPEHKDKTIHHTKKDAENDKEDHFDGKTTE